MPLVWAHAEHIKLLRSLRDGAVFDMPPQTVTRYIENWPPAPPRVWQLASPVERIAPGRCLRLEFFEPARVHWSMDDWKTVSDSATDDSGLGLQFVDLPTAHMTAGTLVRFTMFWPKQNRWQNVDYTVAVGNGP